MQVLKKRYFQMPVSESIPKIPKTPLRSQNHAEIPQALNCMFSKGFGKRFNPEDPESFEPISATCPRFCRFRFIGADGLRRNFDVAAAALQLEAHLTRAYRYAYRFGRQLIENAVGDLSRKILLKLRPSAEIIDNPHKPAKSGNRSARNEFDRCRAEKRHKMMAAKAVKRQLPEDDFVAIGRRHER